MRFLPLFIAGTMVVLGIWLIASAAMGPAGEGAGESGAVLRSVEQETVSPYAVGIAILAGGVFFGCLAAKRL